MENKKREEAIQLTNIYRIKLVNWKTCKTEAEVVLSQDGTSSYSSAEKKIKLAWNATERVRYHELGHEIFHAIQPNIRCTQLLVWAAENTADCTAEEFQALLDLVKEEYVVTPEELTPISDYLGMLADERIPGYRCHRKGYSVQHEPNIFENELFANVCGLIGSFNWRGVMVLMDICPKTLYSCLDVIDKAMHIND